MFVQGFLCRYSSDCSWLDDKLECDLGVEVTPNSTWFGGDAASIRGECQCQEGLWWDEDELECFVEEEEVHPGWGMLYLVLIVVGISACGIGTAICIARTRCPCEGWYQPD